MMNVSLLSRLGAKFLPFLFLWPVLARSDSTVDRFWPQWRGPLATGAAPLAAPPVSWSETNNIKWKTAIPGEGDSTPIVWDDRIFILTAIGTGKKPQTPAAPDAPVNEQPPTRVTLSRYYLSRYPVTNAPRPVGRLGRFERLPQG